VLCNYISKHAYSFPSKDDVRVGRFVAKHQLVVLHLVNMNIAVYTYICMNAFRWVECYWQLIEAVGGTAALSYYIKPSVNFQCSMM